MSNEKPTAFIMRSRFQPCTRYHYLAIKSLILNKEYEDEFSRKENKPIIVLLLIRDIKAISVFWDKVNVKIDNNDSGIQFRHLPHFNSFDTGTAINEAESSLWKYLEEDGLSSDDYNHMQAIFRSQVFVVPINVEFGDICGILGQYYKVCGCEKMDISDNDLPSAITPNIFKKHIESKINTDEKNKLCPEGVKYKERYEYLLSMIGLSALDACEMFLWKNSAYTPAWYFPIFDNEDTIHVKQLSDSYKGTRNKIPNKIIIGQFDPEICSEEFMFGSKPLIPGLYGVFFIHCIKQHESSIFCDDKRNYNIFKDIDKEIISNIVKKAYPEIESKKFGLKETEINKYWSHLFKNQSHTEFEEYVIYQFEGRLYQPDNQWFSKCKEKFSHDSTSICTLLIRSDYQKKRTKDSVNSIQNKLNTIDLSKYQLSDDNYREYLFFLIEGLKKTFSCKQQKYMDFSSKNLDIILEFISKIDKSIEDTSTNKRGKSIEDLDLISNLLKSEDIFI